MHSTAHIPLRDRLMSAFGAVIVAALLTGAAVLPAHMAAAATLGL